jgi:hypothetical protein
MAEENVHIQINYLPAQKIVRWKMTDPEGNEFIYDIPPQTFVRMVDYAVKVLAAVPHRAIAELHITPYTGGWQWEVRRVKGDVLDGHRRTGQRVVQIEGTFRLSLDRDRSEMLLDYLLKLKEGLI